MTRFVVVPDAAAVCHATADRLVELAVEAISSRGVFRVSMCGGSTPKQVYPLLLEPARRDAVDWSAVDFFWGDERSVPADHPESNFGVAYSSFISQLPGVRPERVHRMQAESDDLDAAALAYEAELRDAFGIHGDDLPAFDLSWLGMGPDGHTASVFPGSTALTERERWAIGTWAPALATWRMTLTLPVLNAARATIVAVIGANKATALREIRGEGSSLPAAQVVGGEVTWFIDAAAAEAEA